jgi:hypothetical protein
MRHPQMHQRTERFAEPVITRSDRCVPDFTAPAVDRILLTQQPEVQPYDGMTPTDAEYDHHIIDGHRLCTATFHAKSLYFMDSGFRKQSTVLKTRAGNVLKM